MKQIYTEYNSEQREKQIARQHLYSAEIEFLAECFVHAKETSQHHIEVRSDYDGAQHTLKKHLGRIESRLVEVGIQEEMRGDHARACYSSYYVEAAPTRS